MVRLSSRSDSWAHADNPYQRRGRFSSMTRALIRPFPRRGNRFPFRLNDRSCATRRQNMPLVFPDPLAPWQSRHRASFWPAFSAARTRAPFNSVSLRRPRPAALWHLLRPCGVLAHRKPQSFVTLRHRACRRKVTARHQFWRSLEARAHQCSRSSPPSGGEYSASARPPFPNRVEREASRQMPARNRIIRVDEPNPTATCITATMITHH